MSWCDKLASTAGVGFRLEPHYVPGESLLNALIPITDRLTDGEKQKFAVNQIDPFGVTITTEDGFQYGVDSQRLFVGFQHRMKVRATSGGPPTMEMISHPLPYTELLPAVAKRLVEAAALLPKFSSRKLKRVGVISTTTVADEDLPPGIARFVEYMGRPWRGAVEYYNVQITSEVEKSSGWSDLCSHSMNRPEDQDQMMTMVFDYQRVFSAASTSTASGTSLAAILEQVSKSALKYFEDLAEGNRFDEELIGKAVSA